MAKKLTKKERLLAKIKESNAKKIEEKKKKQNEQKWAEAKKSAQKAMAITIKNKNQEEEKVNRILNNYQLKDYIKIDDTTNKNLQEVCNKKLKDEQFLAFVKNYTRDYEFLLKDPIILRAEGKKAEGISITPENFESFFRLRALINKFEHIQDCEEEQALKDVYYSEKVTGPEAQVVFNRIKKLDPKAVDFFNTNKEEIK